MCPQFRILETIPVPEGPVTIGKVEWVMSRLLAPGNAVGLVCQLCTSLWNLSTGSCDLEVTLHYSIWPSLFDDILIV